MVRWYVDSKGIYSIESSETTPFGPWLMKTPEEAWKKFSLGKSNTIKSSYHNIKREFSHMKEAAKSLFRARMALIKISLQKVL